MREVIMPATQTSELIFPIVKRRALGQSGEAPQILAENQGSRGWQCPSSWLLLCLLLGLGLRTCHYLRDPVIWHDEAALILNAADKNYAEHLGPLFFAEAAPPLFLWLERSLMLMLGENTLAWRLAPFLASCAALIGLCWLARRLLSPWAAVCFALLFACSDRLLWHACEAKPYAVDVFVAALVPVIFWRFRPSTNAVTDHSGRRLQTECFLYASLSPVLVFLSFPACFVLGGLALTLVPAVWRQRRPSVILAFGVFGMALAASFLALLLGPIAAQRVGHLEEEWSVLFAHWNRPWFVPVELITRWSEVCRYACEPIGNVLALFAVVGGVALWRAGRRQLVAVLVLPLVLVSVAWLACRYPMGPTRVMVFAAPAVLLLAAAGCAVAWRWLARRHRFAPALLVPLLLVPVLQAGQRALVPWNRPDTQAALDLVYQNRSAGEIVIGTCWEHTWYCRDLGDDFRTLVAWPFDPRSPAAVGASGIPGSGCWLLLRVQNGPAGIDLPRPEEKEAVARLGIGSLWRIESQHEFQNVRVLHLKRVAE